MKKCPQCGSEKLTEIAPNNGHRQWLCSGCGKVSRSSRSEKKDGPKEDYDPQKGQWINRPTLKEEFDDEDNAYDDVEQTEEKAARSMCELLSKIWIIVGVLLCTALVITGTVSTMEPDGFLTFVIYAVSGGLVLLTSTTVAAILKYLAAKK